MCLLDGVVLGVQTPCKDPLQEVAACSFLVVLAREITSQYHGNSRRSLCIAAAILICRWQMRYQWKAYDPCHPFVWSAADQATNNVANISASLVPSNLC